MRFALLGSLVIVGGPGQQTSLPGPRLRVLLAALLLRANTPVSADALAEAVWDGDLPPAAMQTLRSYVRRLRRALGPEGGTLIEARDPGYLIRLEGAELDVLEFETLCREAAGALRAAAWSQASDAATRALELWRGPPLLDVPSQLLYDEMVPRLEQLRVQALEDLAEADLHLGRHEQLVPQLRDLAVQHPLRERFRAQLMLALYRCNRQAEALESYRDARRALVQELGIEPGPELRRLHERVLAGDTGLLAFPLGGTTPGPGRTALPVPRQLPAVARYFTSRQTELNALLSLPHDSRGTIGNRRTVVISVIHGMAGVGKTALAVHAAHQLADQFPDGQLFLDLHAYTRGYEPRAPGEALEAFLRALGVPPQQIPEDVEQRAALYRQRLADTRTLILLDNAVGEAQVRPLLPGSASCLVLVTSRRNLKGLDDAYLIPLDVLPQADAITLLRAVAGPERLPADDPVLGEIAGLCGRLPLALRIAAALLRHRPVWPPGHLAGLLRDQQQRVSTLDDGERDLGAMFDLSYCTLDGQHQRLFRHLGLIPGPDFDAYAAAALADTAPCAATRLLEDLVDHNLLVPHVHGRYRLHDLIRLHALALAEHDPAKDRQAALDRLLDYYQHTASRADALLANHARQGPTSRAYTPVPVLHDQQAALAWLRVERPNLLAVLRYTTVRAHQRTVALTAGLAALLRTDGPWTQAITLHTTAVTAACQLGDRSGQADALTELGQVRMLSGDYPGATRDLREALRLHEDLGDRRGQADALTELGQVRMLTGDYAGAARDLTEALQLFQDLGERNGQPIALTWLGQVRRATGDYDGAARDLTEALRLFQDVGYRRGQAAALTELGDVRRATGDYAGAARDLQEALRLLQDLGERNGQAVALTWLGAVRRSSGDLRGATRDLQTALKLFRLIGARNNEAVTLNHYAEAVAAGCDQPRALSLYQEALDLAREIGKLDEQARALEGIGECHLHLGDTETGIAHLRQSQEIFRHLAMTPDTERVQARVTYLAR